MLEATVVVVIKSWTEKNRGDAAANFRLSKTIYCHRLNRVTKLFFSGPTIELLVVKPFCAVCNLLFYMA